MKYKLIKEYPGSPKLGTIIEYVNESDDMNDPFTGWIDSDDIEYTSPENYPEFWQEIVEKDYEILSFIIINTNRSYTLLNKDSQLKDVFCIKDGKAPFYNLNELLTRTHTYEIHSVKRLFDGEVFTIGDKITGKSEYNCTINTIELNPDYPQIMFNRLDEGIDLINAKHIKKPLFTTEDGIDIFEDDTFYHTSGWLEPKKVVAKSKHLNYSLPMDRLYSTKEKAEEYILMNKPCLSLKDILEYIDEIFQSGKDLKFYPKLKKLAKTKIKQINNN